MLRYIEEGKKAGARLLVGGEKAHDKGFFVQPTVFADCDNKMKICQEEIFGPVMTIQKFSTIKEVVEKANDTRFGLAAGLVTNSLESCVEIQEQLRAGQVYVNCYMGVQESTPFGGFNDSGIGRELGEDALKNYTEKRTIIMKKPAGLM